SILHTRILGSSCDILSAFLPKLFGGESGALTAADGVSNRTPENLGEERHSWWKYGFDYAEVGSAGLRANNIVFAQILTKERPEVGMRNLGSIFGVLFWISRRGRLIVAYGMRCWLLGDLGLFDARNEGAHERFHMHERIGSVANLQKSASRGFTIM